MYNLRTRNGHNMYDMASLLQKSIRRCDIEKAGYACYELYVNFTAYVWKRLLIISAEDCYGIMTKEIIALKLADDEVNKTRKGIDRDAIFIAKAVYLLCIARKNRDACYVACNFMLPDKCLDESEIQHVDITQYPKLEEKDIPDYVFDVHTLKGKRLGKTDVDMTVTEQKALTPHQVGWFDDASWKEAYEDDIRKGKMTDKELKQYKEHLEFKEFNPSKKLIIDDNEEMR